MSSSCRETKNFHHWGNNCGRVEDNELQHNYFLHQKLHHKNLLEIRFIREHGPNFKNRYSFANEKEKANLTVFFF